MALVKSSVGIGSLLSQGIGDTLRVSLTEDPKNEISAAKSILRALGIIGGLNIIGCPTCGRCRIDLISLIPKLEERIASEGLSNKNIKVAVMGCAVNGPGEAKEADIGIAGGVGSGLLFKAGEIIKKVDEDKLIDELIDEIKKFDKR